MPSFSFRCISSNLRRLSCAVTSPSMATDDARQAAEAAEFRQKLDAMVTAADAKKKHDAACAWVLAATALLKEEQCAAAVLAEEARTAVALIEPPSPLAPVGRAAPLDDDYEVAVIANIHVQAAAV
jgi:hypothetical protein